MTKLKKRKILDNKCILPTKGKGMYDVVEAGALDKREN